MIKRCSEVPFEDIYKTFRKGFSDYIIQFEISEEKFRNHFFGPEGNTLEHSYIAYDQEPIGLVLGGIRTFDGIKTIRCGTMCVVPEKRKNGVAQQLLEKHFEVGRALGCKNAFLECIESNTQALNFYKKNDYRVSYLLKYYNLVQPIGEKSISITTSLDDVKRLWSDLDKHINWQNTLEYLEGVNPNVVVLDGKGFVVFKNNRIFMLYVYPDQRNKGYGKKLISTAHENHEKPLAISFTSNGNLENYLRHIGFIEDDIRQVEMYKNL